MRRVAARLAALCLTVLCLAVLAGCGGPEVVRPPDPPEVRRAAAHRSGPPAQLALVTNISNTSNGGAHSALIIAAGETVVFNPFGTWSHPAAPEAGDVHYGFGPDMEAWFIDYHARETFRVQVQRVEVPMAVAAEAKRRAEATGDVGPAGCTLAISRVLRGLPGFESFPVTLFPDRARNAFAKMPGVRSTVYVDDSPGDWSDLVGGWDGESDVRVAPQQSIAVAAPGRD